MTKLSPHCVAYRVYYEDTDAGGIMYYANYLKFAERARTDMLRDCGVEQKKLREETGLVFVVRSCAVEYLAPARLDDLVEARTSVTTWGNASFSLRQDFFRDGAALATLGVTIVAVGADFKPMRIPLEINDKLARFLAAS